MWKLPFLNLCFVLLVITFVAVHHSVSVFGPTESRYVLVNYDPYQSRSHAAFGAAWKGAQLGDGLWSSIEYLNDLWQRSIIMREWMLEYETTYGGKIRAASGAKADLEEARFHVANAEFLGVAMGEQQRAKVELDRAENYLVKARPLVEENVRPTLETIRKELAATKLGLGTMSSENSVRYERIKAELDHMIERLRFTKA